MNSKEKDNFIQLLQNRNKNLYDIAKSIKNSRPQYLYRYRSFSSEYWENEIFKGEIYFQQVNKFNDPMDSLLYFDTRKIPMNSLFVKRIKGALLISDEDIKTLFKDHTRMAKAISEMRKDIRCACFSENKDSCLMWSHYANQHNGFVIKYNTNKFGEQISKRLLPVIYSAIKPDETEEIRDCTNNLYLKSCVYKAKDWEYEKEWRVLSIRRPEKLYEKKAIDTIYLGMGCSEENRRKIIDWAKDKDVKVFQMQVSIREYKLKGKLLV